MRSRTRRMWAVLVTGLLGGGLVAAASVDTSPPDTLGEFTPPAAAEPAPSKVDEGPLEVYTAPADARGALTAAGVDAHEVATAPGPDGSPSVEAVLSPDQAGELAGRGVPLTPRGASAAPPRGVFGVLQLIRIRRTSVFRTGRNSGLDTLASLLP